MRPEIFYIKPGDSQRSLETPKPQVAPSHFYDEAPPGALMEPTNQDDLRSGRQSSEPISNRRDDQRSSNCPKVDGFSAQDMSHGAAALLWIEKERSRHGEFSPLIPSA
ncbi:hypothetical protein RRG08_042572 [Elysia crispata]|uniref:Uncharacterized protein n=1 Tax=Elysia crispata TaxID=231223 RepID=A0AAE0XQ43_9GAST|nr:hypothetical protein RRG08_042572 [Elysia crispata]